MKLVFLIEYPFSVRDYDRLGIAVLQANGFEVEVWDFAPWLYPHTYAQLVVPDPIDFAGLQIWLTQHEALAALAQLSASNFVMCLIGYRPDTLVIYRALARQLLRYGVSKTGALPMVGGEGAPDIIGKINRFSLARLQSYALRYLPSRLFGVRPATAVLAGGAHSIQGDYPIGRATTIVWAHALDYDLYLKAKTRSVVVNERQGVFIDAYGPFHPEALTSGFEIKHSAEEYYAKLRRFFTYLEDEFDTRIVVAAHPRSRYEDHPDYFGGRPTVRGKTLELIQESGFAISHGSTATSFAVMFERPVLFITDDKMQSNPASGPFIDAMAAYLNCRTINLDQPLTLDRREILLADAEAYARYRDAYIKKAGSPEKPSAQILADYLKGYWPL